MTLTSYGMQAGKGIVKSNWPEANTQVKRKCCVVAASQAKTTTTLRYVLNKSVCATNWFQIGATTESGYFLRNNKHMGHWRNEGK